MIRQQLALALAARYTYRQVEAADRASNARARRAQTPQTAVSRGCSAQMVQRPTGGHATSLRRRLAQLLGARRG